MNKEYKVARSTLIFNYVLFIPAIVIVVVILFASFGKSNPVPLWFIIIWFSILIFAVYSELKKPYIVLLKEGNALVFKSLLSEREVYANSITSIKTDLKGNNIYFRYGEGTITMINRIDNLNELISEIKKNNSSLVTKGC